MSDTSEVEKLFYLCFSFPCASFCVYSKLGTFVLKIKATKFYAMHAVLDQNMLNDPSSCKVARLDRVTFQYQVTLKIRDKEVLRTLQGRLEIVYIVNTELFLPTKRFCWYLILGTILNDSHV